MYSAYLGVVIPSASASFSPTASSPFTIDVPKEVAADHTESEATLRMLECIMQVDAYHSPNITASHISNPNTCNSACTFQRSLNAICLGAVLG